MGEPIKYKVKAKNTHLVHLYLNTTEEYKCSAL